MFQTTVLLVYLTYIIGVSTHQARVICCIVVQKIMYFLLRIRRACPPHTHTPKKKKNHIQGKLLNKAIRQTVVAVTFIQETGRVGYYRRQL